MRDILDQFYGIIGRLIDGASAWNQGGVVQVAKVGTTADMMDEGGNY
jgi:hypothetical protein